ncbi:MAG: hypothetical protein PVI86_11630 [Phycisphaerae bacterium]|jgi:hypothetical protein
MKPWKEVYQQIHPDSNPTWKSLDDAHAWAQREQELIEPVLLRVLDSEYENIPWTHGLPLAREIRTRPIVDALYARLKRLLGDAPGRCITVGSKEDAGITGIIEILGLSGDSRVQPLALALASKECQPSLVVERCVEAIRRVGGRDAIDKLKTVPLRQSNQHIDRLCGLAEKAIRMRLRGDNILAHAESQLRTVTRAWADAVEAQDMQAFLDVQPLRARDVVDEHDFKVELLQSPELPDILAAARKAATAEDDAFHIDEERLQASITVDEKYKFIYVLEVDGWKIGGPLGAGR